MTRASAVLDRNVLVRLVGYRNGTEEAGASFLQTGSSVARARRPSWARSGYAEYAVVDAAAFYKKPTALNFATASTVCSALATADNALFALAGLVCGQTTLIHGASGAVGSFAVQLAKRAGARVIATASDRNVQRVRDLGADVVVDYKKDRFEDHARDVDVVVDTVGGATCERSFALLRRGGVLVTLVPPMPDQESAAQRGIRAVFNRGQSPTERSSMVTLVALFDSRWPETSCDWRGAPPDTGPTCACTGRVRSY
jgi:NADPH:quinone reductase-like Zn-dependent oxidoreductase